MDETSKISNIKYIKIDEDEGADATYRHSIMFDDFFVMRYCDGMTVIFSKNSTGGMAELIEIYLEDEYPVFGSIYMKYTEFMEQLRTLNLPQTSDLHDMQPFHKTNHTVH